MKYSIAMNILTLQKMLFEFWKTYRMKEVLVYLEGGGREISQKHSYKLF